MALEVHIHATQTSILRELLFHPHAGYAELQKPTGLTSDHFNFHIGRLVELGMVEKLSRGTYKLTIKGKEYANRLDTDNNTIERQPKAAVMLALTRIRADSQKEYIFQERLKNPYYGYWGLPTGKLRWGETIIQTAEREALEETGLTGDFTVVGVYHELVTQKETGDVLEDKLFFVVSCANLHGTFVRNFEGGHNEWLTLEDLNAKDKVFDGQEDKELILDGKQWLVERAREYSKQAF